MAACAATWGSVKPLFHYSESMPTHPNPRKHADMPTDLPATDRYDWDIELKSKDAAIRELSMIELVRQSEKMGLYETQKGLKKGIVDIVSQGEGTTRLGVDK